MPERLRGVAYVDDDLPLGGGRYLMEPMVAARLLQAAMVGPQGCRAGRRRRRRLRGGAAGTLARSVIALEEDRELAQIGRSRLWSITGSRSVSYVEAPLAAGHRQRVALRRDPVRRRSRRDAAGKSQRQLAEGGPLWRQFCGTVNVVGRATLTTRTGGGLAQRVIFDAAHAATSGLGPRSRPLCSEGCDAAAEGVPRDGDRCARLSRPCAIGGRGGVRCAWAPAAAQTLTEAFAYAYNNNPQLLAQRALLRATDEQRAAGLANWRPTVNFTGAGRAFERRPVAASQRTRPAFRQLSNKHRSISGSPSRSIAAAAHRGRRRGRRSTPCSRPRGADPGRSRPTVFQAVAQAYLDVVRDQTLVEVNRNNEAVLRKQLEATQDRFRVGEVTRTDVAQAEPSLAQATAHADHRRGQLEIQPGRIMPAPSAIRRAG